MYICVKPGIRSFMADKSHCLSIEKCPKIQKEIETETSHFRTNLKHFINIFVELRNMKHKMKFDSGYVL